MFLVLAPACGTQGNATSLPDNWPRTPLRGFALRNEEQPFALLRLGWDLDQPAVLPRPNLPGQPLSLWGRMSPRQEPTHGTLFRSELVDLGAAVPPEPALTAAAPWEGEGLSSPAWLAGDDRRPPLLFYQGSDGSVGLASFAEDGTVQRQSTTSPLIAASALGSGRIGRVSALLIGERVRLYYIVDNQHVHFAETDAAALWRRAAGEPVAVDFRISPALLWATDFTIKLTTATSAPADHIEGVFVRRVTTPLGRDRFDLYALATAMATATSKSVIVSASSYSGGSLGNDSERFAAVETAALASSDAGTPQSPTLIDYNGGPLLILGLHAVQMGIATATQAPSP